MKNLDNVHMIGHSLGAHLSGYAGTVLQVDFGLKLGRITGLDPAEPHFAQTEAIVRLDTTDAKYVDIVSISFNKQNYLTWLDLRALYFQVPLI